MANVKHVSSPTDITLEQIQTYLETFLPTDIVGRHHDSCDCVLFRYWQNQGYPVLWVYRWATCMDTTPGFFSHPLWLQRFVTLLDEEEDAVDLGGYLPEIDEDGNNEDGDFDFLTAASALNALAECTA